MNDFKWRHYQGESILGCVRWYCKYGISYQDLEEMMLERGIEVDHSTLYRSGFRNMLLRLRNVCDGIGNLPLDLAGELMKSM